MSGYIGHRYRVRSLLGHGGMARVYRVYDDITARELALKQWHGTSSQEQHAREQSISQFEYEYITLAQLSHPCMIEVYDYGLGADGPYFTMELLDGGDLREHAPLPWVRACEIFHDICSSLALLHSRRLIHRDISPRNIRCTPRGGAKLIDFGAMLPMGLCQQVVGTPAFAAPEVVQGLPLDARVDLFSLGATLYFALTGKQPSSARDFAELRLAARQKPVPPSRLVGDIPNALDGLVLSMLDPNPALRPRSAFEVMQRLAGLAQIAEREPLNVAQAYLATPELVGRESVLTSLRRRCADASAGQGGTVVVEGAAGMGRTRVLDVCALWAKTLGATVLKSRANAGGASDRPMSRQLAEQLIAALPFPLVRTLREASADFDALFEIEQHEHTAVLPQDRRAYRLRRATIHGLTRSQEQTAVLRAIVAASREQPLILVIDDANHSDRESLSMLAELSFEAATRPILLVVTWDPDEQPDDHEYDMWPRTQAQRHLRERAERLRLLPLSQSQTTQLLSSLFGDVPHVAMLGNRVFSVAGGNPGATLEIAQWLVTRNIVKYEAGSWALPSTLDAAALPACAADTLRVRLNSLSPLARELARAHALALYDGFSRATYHALCAGSGAPTERTIDNAIGELLRQRLVELEHDTYTVVQRAWIPLLLESSSAEALRRSHEALARSHSRRRRGALHVVHHLLCAGEQDAALDRVIHVLRAQGDDLDFQLFSTYRISPNQTATILAHCLEAACAQQRPRHDEHLLRRWLTILSVLTREEYFFVAAPPWREQLERDCGLKRAAPDGEPVYPPVDAVRNLVGYVSCALAIAGRRMDPQLMASLPPLLQPLTALSPEIRIMWQVAIAAEQALCRCQMEQARARLYAAYEELSALPDSSLHHRTFIRGAIAYAIAACEVSLGMQSAARWTVELDGDPLQAVNAMYLRRVLRLQHGDVEGADHLRRKAELLSMHASAAQMFTSTLVMELVVHGISGDLLGIKQLSAQIATLAEDNPCWRPYAALATGYFERLRGNPAAALAAFEQGLQLCPPSSEGHFTFAWLFGQAGRIETLIDLGRPEHAVVSARKALACCRGSGVIALGRVLVRGLALAEAKLGHQHVAEELLDTAIESARARDVTGLQLGWLYEARTVVAIEAGDSQAIQQLSRLTAHEYGYGHGSSLGARCERLLEAAALREAPTAQPTPSSWGATLHGTRFDGSSPLAADVSRCMAGADAAEGRAARALRLLCEALGASAGHLYLADGHELRLAASHQGESPEAALAELTAQHLASDLQQRADITRVDGDSAQRFEPEPRVIWRDRDGVSFEPKILHCMFAGEARCAGIAWLARRPTPQRSTRPAQFVSALSSYLIANRVTTGL